VISDRVIGALDLQSVEPNAFAGEMLPTFQALADQLAIAIENARLFEQAEQNLRELRELSRDASQRSWAEFLAEAREEEKHYSHGPESKGMQIHRSRVVERVLGAGSMIVSTGKDGRQTFLAAPIVVRNEVVGVLGVEPEAARDWTQDDLQLLQSIAERTALAIENARLYIQAQRAAEREGLINEIASRLQRAPSLAMLLETATRELAEALGTENVYAEISIEKPLGHRRKEIGDVQEARADESGVQLEGEVPQTDASEEARA
jgi:GAF domain-containing protein